MRNISITIPRGTIKAGRIDCRHIATQLVDVEESVDFTKPAMQLSAHEHGQRDSANKPTVIVTHKVLSAVNCPIEDGIVPLSWLL